MDEDAQFKFVKNKKGVFEDTRLPTEPPADALQFIYFIWDTVNTFTYEKR